MSFDLSCQVLVSSFWNGPWPGRVGLSFAVYMVFMLLLCTVQKPGLEPGLLRIVQLQHLCELYNIRLIVVYENYELSCLSHKDCSVIRFL